MDLIYIFIFVIIILLILILSLIVKREQLPYELKESLLTKRELKFFNVLREVIKNYDFQVAIKPRMADFIHINSKKIKKNSYMTYFNKIKSKHIDFLICESTTLKPILGIELDDESHKKKERIERDNFVDSVYKKSGLKIIHIYEYDYSSLREIIHSIS